MQVQGKYNHGWNRYEDQGAEYTDGTYSEHHKQDEYYLSASVLYRPLEGLSFSLAQDGVANTLHNTLPECPFPTRLTSISAFNARYSNDWLTATALLVHTATFEQCGKRRGTRQLPPLRTLLICQPEALARRGAFPAADVQEHLPPAHLQ